MRVPIPPRCGRMRVQMPPRCGGWGSQSPLAVGGWGSQCPLAVGDEGPNPPSLWEDEGPNPPSLWEDKGPNPPSLWGDEGPHFPSVRGRWLNAAFVVLIWSLVCVWCAYALCIVASFVFSTSGIDCPERFIWKRYWCHVAYISACEHAASVSESVQGMYQQQHGPICPSQHDVDCWKSIWCRFLQTHLSSFHSIVSNYRSLAGLVSYFFYITIMLQNGIILPFFNIKNLKYAFCRELHSEY